MPVWDTAGFTAHGHLLKTLSSLRVSKAEICSLYSPLFYVNIVADLQNFRLYHTYTYKTQALEN